MKSRDKIFISKKRFCPGHYLPHKFPFGKKITNELCHIHKNKLNIIHHNIFCRLLKCPNHGFMIKHHKKRTNK